MGKLTYEQEKALIKMKRYRNECGALSIILWLFTIFFILINPNKVKDLFIIPLGAITFTILFLWMAHLVRKVYKIKNDIN